ncbi:MAG: SCO family protein [Anaerolineae bacterium]|nr:SCO family protein [Anaerolineae bacterium]
MNRKVLQVGLGLLLLIGVAITIILLIPTTTSFRGTTYEPPHPAPEIVLKKSNGEEFQLSQYKGEVVILFFGYTNCPDVCPTLLSDLKKVNTDLGEISNHVQVVFITVDPLRDTPVKTQEYVSLFNSDFIGLSGTIGELEQIWHDYGIYSETDHPESTNGYLVTHTARTYVIDSDGDLRLSYGFGTPTEDIVHDLEILLN